MVIAREFEISDIEPIDDIFNRQSQFGVPSLNNVVANKTFEKDGRVLGYGVIKLFAEGVLLIDPDISEREKGEVVRSALKNMILEAKDSGLELLYVIANSEGFSQILRNKCGFKAVPGELLMLDLKVEEEE